MRWARTATGTPGEIPSLGPLGVAVVILVAAWAAAAGWLARNPGVFGRLPRLGNLPILRSAAARLSDATASLRGRLGVDGVTVVALLAGLAVALGLAVLFTALLEDMLDGEGLAVLDAPAGRWLAGHREGWLTTALLAVTRIGDAPVQAAILALVSVVAAIAARSWLPVVLAVAGGAGTGLVIVLAKELIGRQRPPQPFALVASSGYSFPSGHATGAAAIGILCAWMLCRWVVHQWPRRVAVWAVTVATVALIGFSRPYLGVHFITDVLAGWALGAAWAASVIVLVSWRLRRSDPKRIALPADH